MVESQLTDYSGDPLMPKNIDFRQFHTMATALSEEVADAELNSLPYDYDYDPNQ